jgi:MFS family permease
MGKASVTARAKGSLRALNFFMADMQSGIGPFVGVFLLGHGWLNGAIGTVMTIGSIAGVLITAPAGAWVDNSRNKRWMVVISGLAAVLASSIILMSQSFWPVALSQVATAVAGAAVGPAVMGITLGMFRQSGFNRQLGINQAFNHGGNALGAALSGFLGWKFGLPAVLYLALAFGVVSVACVLTIPPEAIDDRSARGLRSGGGGKQGASGLSVLVTSKPLLLLGITLAIFSLGNGAMLPLYAIAVVDAKQGDPAAFVAATVVIAQVTMVFASLLAMRFIGQRGYWPVILVSMVVLPLRAVIAPYVIRSWGVVPMQVLDGITSGLQTVAVPGLVARILNGTGRINAGQGAVLTIQGAGAALSPAIAGWIAQWRGYGMAFSALGACGVVSIVLWIAFASTLAPSRSKSAPKRMRAGKLGNLPAGSESGWRRAAPPHSSPSKSTIL